MICHHGCDNLGRALVSGRDQGHEELAHRKIGLPQHAHAVCERSDDVREIVRLAVDKVDEELTDEPAVVRITARKRPKLLEVELLRRQHVHLRANHRQ